MAIRTQPRPRWTSLPQALRQEIEAILGGAVVSAESQQGGWSPGSADRVVTAEGRRAFVKAASGEVNATTVAMHRREGEVLRALSGLGVAPEPIGVAESGPWFALVVEHLPGRHPEPAAALDTAAVLDAVLGLPDPIPPSIPTAAHDARSVLAAGAAAWTAVQEAGAHDVPGGIGAARTIADLARTAGDAVAGSGLVHLDLRPDNVLVLPDGSARLVDWPNAVIGARWLDALTYLLDVRRLGGATPFEHPVFDDVPAASIDAALAGLAGYFLDAAMQPEPAAMRGIRAFQRLQGQVVVGWLRERGAV